MDKPPRQRNERTSASNVRALRRVPVLVATADRGFLRAATFLLERAGFVVESRSSLCDAVAAVRRTRPSAVILDATESRLDAARAASAIEAGDPPVHVFLVSDEKDSMDAPGAMLAKWSSLDLMIDELRGRFGVVESRRNQNGGKP